MDNIRRIVRIDDLHDIQVDSSSDSINTNNWIGGWLDVGQTERNTRFMLRFAKKQRIYLYV